MQMRSPALAHSENRGGTPELLCEHLRRVAERAAEYARPLGLEDEARAAGLLHDLGKYGEVFQARLRGQAKHVDHWSISAQAAVLHYRNVAAPLALSVLGHHIGLREKDSFKLLSPARLAEWVRREGFKLSAEDSGELLRLLEADGLELPEIQQPAWDGWADKTAAAMLDVRMLFSCLVDADFIETEAHFNGTAQEPRKYRPAGPELEPERALEAVLAYIESLAKGAEAAGEVLRLRRDLLDACLKAAEQPPGIFTLTAPTGAGKTLSMLAFALKHAALHGLRRVVTVIPYLTIIEQTVGVYRKALEPLVQQHPPGTFVLEDHSLAERGPERGGSRIADGATDTAAQQSRLLAENWDAPVVVTTSVQLLESLFAHQPSRCRKLHRLAHSVILFDEVQTLPKELAVPTLATLSHLSRRYGATIVFATATQPAFDHLDKAVESYSTAGWQPREIVPAELELFERARRTRVHWPKDEDEIESWRALAERLAEHEQALCIVNLKRHALELFGELKGLGDVAAFHLSTNMCPAHRTSVLEEIRARLERGQQCILVSTQCVEAGVDVDFPVLYRAMGPLEAIAQAAGRCNRNGLMQTGKVVVFKPPREQKGRLYPDSAYEQAALVAENLLAQLGAERMDINDPELFRRYYRQLYDISGIADERTPLLEKIAGLIFPEVARLYRVIPDATVSVLVPYDRERFEELAAWADEEGLTREWVRAARPHAIGLYRRMAGQDVYRALPLEPVPVRRRGTEEKSPEYIDWFIYRGSPEDYDPETGLRPSEAPGFLIA